MLLTSDFILNACERPEQWTVYPYIHSNCNHLTDANQLRQVKTNGGKDWHFHTCLKHRSRVQIYHQLTSDWTGCNTSHTMMAA